MREVLLFGLLMWAYTSVNAQVAPGEAAFNCGSIDAPSRVQSINDLPAYQALWKQYQAAALAPGGVAKSLNPTYRLPIVIHVIHDCAPVGDLDRNPPEGYLKSILNDASLRFRHQQPGAPTFTNPLYGADTEIELCLATTDPNGNYTTGIVRHNDGVLSSSDDWISQMFDLQDAYGWPTGQYLNMYLVENTNTAGGAGGGLVLIRTDLYNAGLINHEMETVFVILQPSLLPDSREGLTVLATTPVTLMKMILLPITPTDQLHSGALVISQICYLTIWTTPEAVGMPSPLGKKPGCTLQLTSFGQLITLQPQPFVHRILQRTNSSWKTLTIRQMAATTNFPFPLT